MIRRQITFLSALWWVFTTLACAQQSEQTPASQAPLADFPTVIYESSMYNELSPKEKTVIINKGTEWAFSGAYHDNKDKGTYICKQCNLPLFRSEAKFDSGTGWPSFDDMIADNVREVPDADGMRTEIVCANCGGHLGHVFRGEGFTRKQTRHCVNSASLDFVPKAYPAAKAQK